MLTEEYLDKQRHVHHGFPLGKHEDILALSEAPYFTLCPNPFIKDFIKKFGTPYHEENDHYHKEPFATDVKEGKNEPIYKAHSYHTKVPYKAIMKYILHYTEPGDIVFDGFCGTGMTGVAARMCGNPDMDFRAKIEEELGSVQWGERKAILSDLSPSATFIAYNYNFPMDILEFKDEVKEIITEVEDEYGWMYETQHTIEEKAQRDAMGKPILGKINHIIWSDVFVCPQCKREIVFWKFAVDRVSKRIRREFNCPDCCLELSKINLERSWSEKYDSTLGRVIRQAKQVPVLINYSIGRQKFEKNLDKNDLELIKKIDNLEINYWYPTDMLPEGHNTKQPIRTHGLTHAHHFYTKRALTIIAAFAAKARDRCKRALWLVTAVTEGSSKLNRERPFGLPSKLHGTLYISSMIREINVLEFIKRKAKRYPYFNLDPSAIIQCASTTNLENIPDEVCDYIFTDPPFGSNIMYSELNFLWEAWLKVFTNNSSEAIINKSQNKGLDEYQKLMEDCCKEMFRILKSGRWLTLVFNNSNNEVWNSLQESLHKAGFVIADVKVLDKKQGSFKQVTTKAARKEDLVISAFKPKREIPGKLYIKAGTEEDVWRFIKQYLEKLPIVGENDGLVEERVGDRLYDRLVGFCLQKGYSIPISAEEFRHKLGNEFIQRDGMFFLPDQLQLYEQAKNKV